MATYETPSTYLPAGASFGSIGPMSVYEHMDASGANGCDWMEYVGHLTYEVDEFAVDLPDVDHRLDLGLLLAE